MQYKNNLYQIKTSRPEYALRKKTVNIFEKESGEIIIKYKNKNLDYRIYHEQPYQGEIISSKVINHKITELKKRDSSALKYKPSKYHPWKSSPRGPIFNYSK